MSVSVGSAVVTTVLPLARSNVASSEIWVDVYDIVRLLASHRSSIRDGKRLYPYRDLDVEEFLPAAKNTSKS